jgi:hypothetical protein
MGPVSAHHREYTLRMFALVHIPIERIFLGSGDWYIRSHDVATNDVGRSRALELITVGVTPVGNTA